MFGRKTERMLATLLFFIGAATVPALGRGKAVLGGGIPVPSAQVVKITPAIQATQFPMLLVEGPKVQKPEEPNLLPGPALTNPLPLGPLAAKTVITSLTLKAVIGPMSPDATPSRFVPGIRSKKLTPFGPSKGPGSIWTRQSG